MKNLGGIVAWYSADVIPSILSFSSNISITLIFILNSKIALVFETEKLNWTANELNEGSLRRVGKGQGVVTSLDGINSRSIQTLLTKY